MSNFLDENPNTSDTPISATSNNGETFVRLTCDCTRSQNSQSPTNEGYTQSSRDCSFCATDKTPLIVRPDGKEVVRGDHKFHWTEAENWLFRNSENGGGMYPVNPRKTLHRVRGEPKIIFDFVINGSEDTKAPLDSEDEDNEPLEWYEGSQGSTDDEADRESQEGAGEGGNAGTNASAATSTVATSAGSNKVKN